VLAHIHPFLQWFAPESDPIQALRLCMSGASGSARCPEPLRPFRALPLRGWCSTPSRKALPFPLRYYRLMRQSQTLPSPPASRLGRRVFASCCQSRLGEGPSRRYLCESFPAYLDPYPGCSCGAFAHFFPQDIGLPHVVTRSALCTFFFRAATSSTGSSFGAAAFVFLQARRFACHPSRPYRSSSFPGNWAAVAFPSEHLTDRYLPVPRIC
jgi:hypothetical protein